MPTANQTRTAPGWDRQRALDATLVQVERRYGRGAVWRLGGQPIAPVPVIPTGSLTLDLALGVGGLPRGRISEVYGQEAAGKTTLALSVIAQAQQAGGTALFIDAEHALDLAYVQAVGVDLNRLLVCQPDSGEHALAVLETLVYSGALEVAVVDSVPALVPRVELEGEVGDSYTGAYGRLMAQAMRKLAGPPGQDRHRPGPGQPAPRQPRRAVRLRRAGARRPRPQAPRRHPPRPAAHRDHQGRRRPGHR